MAKKPSRHKFAILIDADNISHRQMGYVMHTMSNKVELTARRAYGDWFNAHLRNWRSVLLKHNIEAVQQLQVIKGKNLSDIALVIDAMDLLHRGDLDGICIVSSDSDFTPLCQRIRGAGMIVYGVGRQDTPPPFVNACDSFLFLHKQTSKSHFSKRIPTTTDAPSDVTPIIEAQPEFEDDESTSVVATVQELWRSGTQNTGRFVRNQLDRITNIFSSSDDSDGDLTTPLPFEPVQSSRFGNSHNSETSPFSRFGGEARRFTGSSSDKDEEAPKSRFGGSNRFGRSKPEEDNEEKLKTSRSGGSSRFGSSPRNSDTGDANHKQGKLAADASSNGDKRGAKEESVTIDSRLQDIRRLPELDDINDIVDDKKSEASQADDTEKIADPVPETTPKAESALSELEQLFVDIVTDATKNKEWTSLNFVGAALKRKDKDFDIKKHNYKRLLDAFRAMETLFEIERENRTYRVRLKQ